MREGLAPRGAAGVGRLTVVLGVVMALGPLAIDMYLPALPALQGEFATSAARVQQTLSAYLLGLAVGQLAFGPLADRYGRKAPLLGGLALFAAASAGCALAGAIEAFVLLRFVQALGGASGMVVIRAVIRDRFDEIQSARVLSLMMLVMGAAPILAPLGGGWLLVNGSWHWIFAFLAGFALLCIALVALLLEESHPVHRRSRSVGRAIAASLPLFADLRFLGPVIVFIGAFGCFFAYLAAAPFVFIEVFGVPAERFGVYFGANAFGFLAIAQVNRRAVTRYGTRPTLGFGLAVLSLSALALLACSVSGTFGFAGVFVPLFFMVAAIGFIASNASAIAMAPFGERAGGASSLLGAAQSGFGVLASAAVGWVGGRGAVPMAIIIAACAATALASYLFLIRGQGRN
ncbi:MAG TPA: Bcr/CflA family multidrug efflux MFS transporter [Burkholderiales bacterium]